MVGGSTQIDHNLNNVIIVLSGALGETASSCYLSLKCEYPNEVCVTNT